MVVVDMSALTHAHAGTHDVQAVASLCRTICFEDSCHSKSVKNIKFWLLSTWVDGHGGGGENMHVRLNWIPPPYLLPPFPLSPLFPFVRLDGNDGIVTVGMGILAGETRAGIVWCLQQLIAAGQADSDPGFIDWLKSEQAHFMDRGPGMSAFQELDLDHAPMYLLLRWEDGWMGWWVGG